MRTRRPFPDVEEQDPEALGAVLVDTQGVDHDANNAAPAFGFIPHDSENRRTRKAAVANWQPTEKGMPSRRELVKQRQRNARGKLDPQLRRLQREKLQQKGRK